MSTTSSCSASIFAHFTRQMDAEHEEVVNIGGLHILGTERHEARRIDNQLRGRAGRQGDPGSSRFYLLLEDDLMRIFGSDRIAGLMQRLGMEEGVPIEHGMVTRAIERAQKQVEAQNFGVRKHLLEYDDVMNKQRESVYTLRREVLDGHVHLTEDEVVDTKDYLMALAESFSKSRWTGSPARHSTKRNTTSLQHDVALDSPQQLRTDQRLFFLVAALDHRPHRIADLVGALSPRDRGLEHRLSAPKTRDTSRIQRGMSHSSTSSVLAGKRSTCSSSMSSASASRYSRVSTMSSSVMWILPSRISRRSV